MVVVGSAVILMIPLLLILVLAGLMISLNRNKQRYSTPEEQIRPSDRVYVNPLLKSRARLETILEKYGSHPNVKVIGGEALGEIDQLIQHAETVLKTELPEHRKELVAQFEDARAQIDDLVDDLEKTAAETQSAEASDALRQSLSRIQSLSASLDEAEQLTDRNL